MKKENKFSNRSMRNLRTCDSRLIDLFTKVLQGYDCTIIEGVRGKDAQDEAFFAGKSNVRWPYGKHNKTPSLAVDVSPYPIKWPEHAVTEKQRITRIARFYHFAGYVRAAAEFMNIPVIWGGDWNNDLDFTDQTFNDFVHWEIRETKQPDGPA